MASKILMSLVMDGVMKELAERVPEDKKIQVENEISKKLGKSLGNDWKKLPTSGPRMMALYLVMNLVLVPYGITPMLILDAIIKKGKNYELDDKYNELLESGREQLKDKGEYTKEKLSEFIDYSEGAGKKIGENLKEIMGIGAKNLKQTLNKSKSYLKNLKDNNQD
ncbi:MAG: hypothetical protein OEZ01_15675 [Candidatus Heimdallarchaeota archaeon]|nr:hypothetical protein [Candidatus Heimdallarchaeota archaeon]MDH5647449.1 hypothetical protein [Candidatus Heimdallarchaeota archaeon]